MNLHVDLHLPERASGFQIRRLRIEIEKLQWLHQQELSEMKHNLGEIIKKPPCIQLLVFFNVGFNAL